MDFTASSASLLNIKADSLILATGPQLQNSAADLDKSLGQDENAFNVAAKEWKELDDKAKGVSFISINIYIFRAKLNFNRSV